MHAEVIAQRPLDRRLRHLRVAVLVQQTRLGGEEEAGPVHVERTSLHNHRPLKATHPERFGDLRWDRVIKIEGRILSAPSVVVPIRDRDFTRLVVFHEDRAVIATPRIVGRMIVERHSREHRLGLGDQRPRALLERIGDIDPDFLVATDPGDDLRELCRNHAKVSGPRGEVMRPRKPHGGLRLPLGRHAETQRLWRRRLGVLGQGKRIF